MILRKKIALFASGSGTNVENIIRYFQNKKTVDVVLVLTNKPSAGVIKRSEDLGVPVQIFDRKMFYESDVITGVLKSLSVDLIVLAGFLWIIPGALIEDFPNRIINIHPALLPKFGGKGMYGMNVHQAVINSGERKSGITIHFVNEQYDEGQIVFQKDIPVYEGETAEDLATRIHQLEYQYYPEIIEKVLNL